MYIVYIYLFSFMNKKSYYVWFIIKDLWPVLSFFFICLTSFSPSACQWSGLEIGIRKIGYSSTPASQNLVIFIWYFYYVFFLTGEWVHAFDCACVCFNIWKSSPTSNALCIRKELSFKICILMIITGSLNLYSFLIRRIICFYFLSDWVNKL